MIRKKSVTQTPARDDSEGKTATDRANNPPLDISLRPVGGPSPGPGAARQDNRSSLVSKALEDLRLFLERKGVDPSRADEFEIHIKQKNAVDASYSVHYTDPFGSMLSSKNDVLLSIQLAPSGSRRQTNSNSGSRLFDGGGSSREQRNLLREQMRSMDPAEVKRLAQASREQEEKLREEKRRADQAERDRERERREAEKERERERKEQARKEQKNQRIQEAEKAKSIQKERTRKDDKARQQLRRDVTAEQKKTRTTAACAVLDQFDIEEDLIEMHEALAAPHLACRVFEDVGADKDAAAVASVLSRLQDGFDTYGISPGDVENVLDVSTCLHAYQGLLKLPTKVFKLDAFLPFLKALSSVAPRVHDYTTSVAKGSTTTSSDSNPSVKREKVMQDQGIQGSLDVKYKDPSELGSTGDTGAMEVQVEAASASETDKPVNSIPSQHIVTDLKLEQERSESEHWKRLQDAEVDLDRVQLHLLRPVVAELNAILGLHEPGKDEAAPGSKKDSKRSVVHHGSGLWTLPLNQLTWAELTRMCILMRIGQELNKTDEEINYIIKGGKPPFFRSTKNIMRALRYKMLVKKRVESLGEEHASFMSQFVSSQLSMDEKSDSAIDGFDLLEKAMLMSTPEYGSGPRVEDDDDAMSPQVLENARSKFGLSFNIGNVELDFSSENELLSSMALASRGIEGHLYIAELEAVRAAQEAAALSSSASEFSDGGGINASEKPPIEAVAKLPGHRVVSYLPGLYRRCCKVWVKIANMTAAKNFFWEVDRDVYPEYYDLVKKPIALSAIAYKLSTMAYGSVAANVAMGETEADVAYRVAKAFYRDFRTMCINCVTFNSEITPLVFQAQKVLQAAQRHIQKWVLFPKQTNGGNSILRRPMISECDEQHCLHTFDVIQQSRTLVSDQVRCGRCSGVYSLQGLENCFLSVKNNGDVNHMDVVEPLASEMPSSMSRDRVFYVTPTTEVINAPSEEWICVQCLKDEFAINATTPPERCHYSPFVINQWGCSTYLPWNLNGATSSLGSDLVRVQELNGNCGYAPSSHLRHIGENIVCDEGATMKSNVHSHVGGLPVQVLLLESAATVICDTQKSPILPQNETVTQPHLNVLLTDKSSGLFFKDWTISDRLCVLRGLCELLRLNPTANGYATALHHECKKLARIAGQPVGEGSLAIEGSFLALCRTIAGDEAIPLVKRRLDGIEGSGSESWLEEQFQNNAIMAGRCLICKGSTFEEDCTTPDMLVLLCDGCNVEAHLKCAGLVSVPSGEWFCESCAQRVASRGEDGTNSPLAIVQQINQHRLMDDESRLLGEVLDRLERNRDLTHEDDGTAMGTCAYCGMTELELTSPFVVGQSREEFDAYIDMFDGSPEVDGVIGTAKGTVVEFSILCEEIDAPPVEIPEFPLLGDKNASKLLGVKSKKGNQANCPIVHQICALNMFCNRVARQTHATRRIRRSIADQVINLSGIATFPIGIDDNQFSYWKLPVSDDLFICNSAQVEPWKDMLRFGKKSKEISKIPQRALDLQSYFSRKRWIRICDIDAISKLVFTCLSDASPNECSLRRSISSIFLTADRVKEFQQKQEATLAVSASLTSTHSAEETEEALSETFDADEENSSDSDKENDVVDSAVEESNVADDTEVERKSKRGKATTLVLVKKKGVDVPKRSLINQEVVFDDSDICWAADDENDEASYAEYFQFSKTGRYYAVALVDDFGVRVRHPRPGTTVINQVHRDGILQPLAYTPLKEPWTDGIYYFSSLTFKRSGFYTISFAVEGPGVTDIKPLIFNFSVEARHILRGAPNTYARLNARNYAHAQDRQISWGRREINAALSDLRNELCVVRSVLLTVYAALPAGALVMGPESEDSPSSLDEAESLAEPEGWNRVLDRCWRNMVFQASTAQEMMECVLLLEYYIARQWFDGTSFSSGGSSRPPLLGALPGTHSAVRCATLSAAALRVFTLDRVLIYDKIQHIRRGSRLIGGDNKPVAQVSAHASRPSTGSGTASRPKVVPEKPVPPARTTKNSGFQPPADTGRLHRASFESASRRLSSSRGAANRDSYSRGEESDSDSSYFDDDDSRTGRRSSERKRKNTPKGDEWANFRNSSAPHQMNWICPTCGVENEARARTCSCCEERKPAANMGGMEESFTPKLSRGERMKKRQRYDDDSFDDEPEPTPVSRSTAAKKKNKNETLELANIDDFIAQLIPQLPVPGPGSFLSDVSIAERDNNSAIPQEKSPEFDALSESTTVGTMLVTATGPSSMGGGAEERRGVAQSTASPTMETEHDVRTATAPLPDNAETNTNVVDLSIRMLSILRRLQKDPTSIPFWFPVPHDLYPDYRARIREPMDFGTIAERVRSLNYYAADVNLFERDVSLVWSNCYTYNLEGSGIYENAKALEKEFRRLLEAWIIDANSRPGYPDIN